jgi:hypothetical protein
MKLGVTLLALAAALTAVPLAEASYIVARNASGITLRVSGGTAIVNYRAGGATRHVAPRAAARASPTTGRRCRSSSPHARRRTGATGRSRTGSG